MEILLMIFLVLGFVIFFASLKSGKKKRRIQQAQYSSDNQALTYSRYDLQVSVDKARKLVTVNGTDYPLEQFSYSTKEERECVTYNTGGNQTVYGSGGAIGTVYVPGESRSHFDTVGYTVRIYNSDFAFTSELKKSHDALIEVLEQIALEALQNALETQCQQAGISKDCFKIVSYAKQGKLSSALAVDRSGKAVAVYNNGTETWMGSLKGASARILDVGTVDGETVVNAFELKVDDPAYREKHLTERRITLLVGEKYEVRDEWKKRINLLAKTAA